MGVPAGLLVRISDDRSGEGLGVERQEADCRDLAQRRGLDVVKVYRENDTSAYQRRSIRLPDGTTALRVVRPAFRELLADLAEGTISALVAYDLDRVARDPRDLEDLIDAVELRHVPAMSVTGSLDLSNDAGITMARVQVAIANKASRDTSRRVTRAMKAVAEAGRPGGGAAPFGYTSDRLTVVPDEAKAVRWMHAQVRAGRSLQSIAVELREQYPHRRWDSEAVTRIITSRRYIGRRVHRGLDVGPALWPAIIDLDAWEMTQAVLADRHHPSRKVGPPSRYLLTGLLRCGRCGKTLHCRRIEAGRVRFGCMPKASGNGCGGSAVAYQPAEELVTEAVLARLGAELTPASEADDSPAEALRRQIAELEQQQVDLGQQLADGNVSLLVVQSADRALRERIAVLRAQEQETRRSRRTLDPAAIVRSWPDLDLDRRRAVVQSVIDYVEVGPARNNGPRFSPERLTIVWR